jgi:non-specific serine/threonine protein kinase
MGCTCVLFFAIMGPNAGTVLKLAPECQIGEPCDRRYPKLWAKRLLRDTLLGLQFLHSNNIVHGDLHLGNILFTVKLSDTQSNPPEILEQRPDEGFPLQRLDGKIDLWAPKYLLEPRALYEYTSLELDPLVKITDLGGGENAIYLPLINIQWLTST